MEQLRARLDECFLIAESSEQVVGFAIGQIRPTKGNEYVEGVLDDEPVYLEVQDIYVTADHRERGIGMSLMQELIARGVQKGANGSLVYSANRDYIRTAQFYEELGYEMWHIHMTRKDQGQRLR